MKKKFCDQCSKELMPVLNYEVVVRQTSDTAGAMGMQKTFDLCMDCLPTTIRDYLQTPEFSYAEPFSKEGYDEARLLMKEQALATRQSPLSGEEVVDQAQKMDEMEKLRWAPGEVIDKTRGCNERKEK